MKTLYFDCGMGAAGDMLSAALLELMPEPQKIVDELNGLDIPGVHYSIEKSVKCGITGSHVTVTVDGVEEDEFMHDHHHDHEGYHEHHDDHDHDHHHHDAHDNDHHHDDHGDHAHHHDHEHGDHAHHHHHSGMADIEHIVKDHMKLPDKVRDDVLGVYELIAQAESHVHSVPVNEIHFHEVGTMDAIADITAVCLLLHKISPDRIVVSPVNTGSGQVRCAHGILPVPAPATAFILQGIPAYSSEIKSELCTPTGAALLKHFADSFGTMPVMQIEKIGYGMGKKDFEAANCVRIMLGDSEDKTDTITELSCNVDDMTSEAVGFAMDRFFDAGALEVYTVPVGMKKNRPGILIKVLCKNDDREKMVRTIFKYTTTIGIRENAFNRYVLERKNEELDTPYGIVRCKTSSGYDVNREKLEYDDICRIAKEQGKSLWEITDSIRGSLRK